MKITYSDADINFSIDGVEFSVPNIVFGRFTRTIPSHSHGKGCFEIHYIPFGCGRLKANGHYYDITPNTLYVTGPHIEHAQFPLPHDPMQEYCVYIKTKKFNQKTTSPLMNAFFSTPFWFGKDNHGIHALMKQIFKELEHKYTGYQKQVELLLAQLVICLVRNYDHEKYARDHSAPGNLMDSNSIIIEEYFLYEYASLSLNALADKLKLSPRQTQRLIWKYYGKSFQQKKAEARMSVASILLKDEDRSIAFIADTLGYSSPEHFSAAFRKYYKMSPSEFRKLNPQA
ncbi:MAG: AraC family transcriptional regulator [Clostridiaceae bacterium]|nr:AraC family transcriptional regulator [Clostridiaceae bacterium]